LILSQDQTLVISLFSGTLSITGLSCSVSIMTLASFRRELYRSRFDSQRSWNGHALSSFQTSSPNCIWIALQTTQSRPKQTGILTNDLNSVKPTSADSPDLFGDEKASQSSRNLAEEATLKVVTNSLFSNPLMPS